jgi:uncharacterized membrane protein YphA (DoxX/SURF4 family)
MATLVQTATKWYQAEIRCLGFLKSPLLLLLRLYFGWQFVVAGLGKLEHVDATATTFAGWGIPAPTLNVYMAGTTETVCGFLFLLGAASRLITIPLLGTMVVAYATAHRGEVFGNVFGDPLLTVKAFVHAPPFFFLVSVLIVLIFGPGWLSVDALLHGFFAPQVRSSDGSTTGTGPPSSSGVVLADGESNSHPTMNRREATRLAVAAVGGLLAGAIGYALFAGKRKVETTVETTDTSTAALPRLLQDPHVCRGINTCVNKGKMGTTNTCAGQGHCATAAAHDCQGMNDCKGQGGCAGAEPHPGENECKGQGGCAVPLDPTKVWPRARKRFEELMTKAGKKFGNAPPLKS